jgi:hypothetical protein
MTTEIIHKGTLEVTHLSSSSGVTEITKPNDTIEIVNVGASTTVTEIAVVQNVTGLNATDIKTKYEQNADTNAFTDDLKAKLENDVLTQEVLKRSDIVIDGTYVEDLTNGKHKYKKNGTTYYRLITTTPSYTDIIYSDLACTNEIARKG